LEMELWRGNDCLMQTVADGRGEFRFIDVPLNEQMNVLRIAGGDGNGNVAAEVQVQTYLDVEPPTVEIGSPDRFVNDDTPLISAMIEDEGVGMDDGNRIRRSIELTIDGRRVQQYNFVQGRLTYQMRDEMEDGEHIIGITAVDNLGNAPEEPIRYRFYVDTQDPRAIHRFFEGDEDTISNRSPELAIPIFDPRPSGGIAPESIVLILDRRNELEFEWDDHEQSVYYDFGHEELDAGRHELAISGEDRAGNEFASNGTFFVNMDRVDREPPFFENMRPSGGSVAGGGLREDEGGGFAADTISFAFGDDDAGVDYETLRVRIISRNDPDDPDDDDTTWVDFGDMVIRAGTGRVLIPLVSNGLGRDGMDDLEEGINDLNAFGEDNDGNGGEEDWDFFMDETDPDAPVLDEPDDPYVNTSEVTVTGTMGDDLPVYDEDYENEPTLLIYCNDSLVSVIDVEYDEEFVIEDILLVEGENFIYATAIDGGGNESDTSNVLALYLDLAAPEIVDFDAIDGPNVNTATPEFTATLLDADGEIDPDNISLTIGEVDVPTAFDAETDLMTAQVEDDLDDGDYTAVLIAHDLAGNPDTSQYDFSINTQPVDPPIFTLERYTSSNQVSLTGEGVVGTVVHVFLNDEEVGEVSLDDAAEFEFDYTAPSLDDISDVDLMAVNSYGTESEHTDPQELVVDNDPPEFSDSDPGNGVTVEVNDLEEITIFVGDLIAGVDPDAFVLEMREEELEITVTETDSGYWLTADVSEEEFEDDETVYLTATAFDLSVAPNQQQFSWEFIIEVNEAPVVALPDDAECNEDEQFTLDLHDYISDANDAWQDLDFSSEIVVGADNAELTYDEENDFLHILPEEDWFGELHVRVAAVDPYDAEGVDTMMVEVLPANDAPGFVSAPDDATIIENEQFDLQLDAEDIDPGDELSYYDNSDLFDIDANGLVSFTPDETMIGSHTIEFYVYDVASASDTVEFHLQIDAANQPLELISELDDTVLDEDADPVEIADLDDIFNDPDDVSLTFLVEYDGDGVTLDIDGETNVATLSLDPDFNGDVTVTVTADNLDDEPISDDFLVEVLPINDAPRQEGLLPDEVVIDEDSGREIIASLDTVFVDVDGDDLLFDWEGGEHLGVDIDQGLVLSITPDNEWAGEESFILSVDDGVEEQILVGWRTSRTFLSATDYNENNGAPRRDAVTPVEITVVVQATNDPPEVMVDDPYIVDMEEDQDPLTVDVAVADMFSDSDVDDELTISWDELGGPIELSFDGNEEYIIATIVEENFNGDYEYPITATDLMDAETSLPLMFSVAAVNDPPEVIGAIDDVEVGEDAGEVIIADLGDVFSDVDGDGLTYSVSEAPGELHIDIDDNDVLYLHAADDYNLNDGVDITVTADDGEGGQRVMRFRPTSGRADILVRNNQPVRSVRSVRVPDQIPRRDATVDDQFLLVITPVNDAPFWIETNDQLADEGDLVEFDVTADDVDLHFEGDDLMIEWDRGELPGEAGFTDNGDGTG
ncbi:MAG: Ig-like domain-containing protein, partial [Candidatus Electryoneaceae bacterium]|nr:Ig-like domain-containing protein [Candidatus Electryoneaceae bacterium]